MVEKATVLVVDDNRSFADLLSEHINEQDDLMVVDKAYDGRSALEKIEKHSPNLVILDIIMPYVDGISVLGELNKLNLVKKPKIILLSAIGQDDITKEAIELGADFYIVKPFDFESFLSRVRQLLSMQRVDEGTNLGSNEVDKLNYLISGILDKLGVPAHIKGYQYIVDAIKIFVLDEESKKRVTTYVYPYIAKKYDTTPSRVERAIRNAIEITLTKGNRKNINSYFLTSLNRRNGKVSNSEFIKIIATKIKI